MKKPAQKWEEIKSRNSIPFGNASHKGLQFEFRPILISIYALISEKANHFTDE